MIDINNKNENLSFDFKHNLSKFEERFKDCPDIIRREVTLNIEKIGCFFYIQGLIDIDLAQRDFIGHVLNFKNLDFDVVRNIENKIPVAEIKFPLNINGIVTDILGGNIIFIGEGMNYAISCALKSYDKRSIEEPIGEKSVRGSHAGFIEDLGTNMAMLRRSIKNFNLKFKTYTVGSSTNQTVAIAYINTIANLDILKILCDKISKLNFDGFIGVGYIEQIITDNKNSIFPQYLATERLDKVTAALLEGRFAIFLEGTPVVLIAPVNIFSFLQTTDDYNPNWISGSFVRLIRVLSWFITLFLPGIYIALVTFHYYMVPLTLLVPLAQSRSRVPFPPIIEALIMELVIELIREASIRLPTYIGNSVGVVGGLIIGQAAVQAGIVSDLMVIIVSVTAIAAFSLPNYDMSLAVRIMRFIIMINSAIFGITGMVISFSLILCVLITLESLGQPYLQPIIPFKFSDIKDTIIRFPIKYLKIRPNNAKPKDKIRGNNNE